MIEIRSSTSAPGGSIGNGNGDGNGSGFAFACGFGQWAPPSQVAVTSAGGWVPYHLSPITYHVPEAGAEAGAEGGRGDSSINPGPRPETETGTETVTRSQI